MMLVALCIPFPFSTPCDAMLTMLICATHWLSMHLYTLAYTSMHKSCLLVCHPCFNTMKLWIFNPNLHLSLVDTSFCSLSCLFTHLLVCLLYCSFACHAYHTYLLYAFSYAFALLPSIACLLVCLSLPLHVHTWSEDVWNQGMVSQASKKGASGSMSIRAKRLCSKGLEVQFSHLVMYSFKPLSSFSLSLLDGLHQVYHAMYHSSSSPRYGDPCLLSCTYILGHALGMQASTFLHYVLALCMMYVYIYLLVPSSVIVTIRVT